ncbi:LysE family translocator [Nocardia tengchongensis]|uniref:LysE family translocator n=1 Tax=Nocardia tengchongensis TaxID=2055889 RepID=UPI0036CEE2A8
MRLHHRPGSRRGHRPHPADTTALTRPEAAPHGTLRIPRDGFVVGVANPKTTVFFAAVLPQFVDPQQGHAIPQMLLIFNIVAVACDSTWGMAAAAARTWFADSPKHLAAVGGAGGLAMIGLGVTVAVTGRRD